MSHWKESLSKKITLSLILLGFILFCGTALIIGFTLYYQTLMIYEQGTVSDAGLLGNGISKITSIDYILDHADDIRYTYDNKSSITDQQQANIYTSWSKVNEYLLSYCEDTLNYRYVYVAIPTNDDLICIWGTNNPENFDSIPFEHLPYQGTEKENLLQVMNNELSSDFFSEKIDGRIYGTSVLPVKNSHGNTRAVMVIVIAISDIRTMIIIRLALLALTIFIIMAVCIWIYGHFVQKQLIHPLAVLTNATDVLVNDLWQKDGQPIQVDVHTGDELDTLARAFEEMDAKLQTSVWENAAIIAENERIETELKLATKIQTANLPNDFSTFSGRDDISLYATMTPTTEVGGDFYDFFMIDDNRIALVIGDASGHGIPAALYMMMAKTIIRIYARHLKSPAEVMEQANNQFLLSTGKILFVTVWFGVLDLKENVLTAANAGHKSPVIKTPKGRFKLIRDYHNVVIGGCPDISYTEYKQSFPPGSKLFIYTDGLTEATNAEGKMFNAAGMLSALNEVNDATPEEILSHVTQAVRTYSGDKTIDDDITMLCLHYLEK